MRRYHDVTTVHRMSSHTAVNLQNLGGDSDDEYGHAQGVVLNITLVSLGRTSSASVAAARPCSYGRFIITASQLLPLLPPPHPPSSCILPPLPPFPLLLQISLHRYQRSSLPSPPPFALGRASLSLTVHPLFPCLLNNPSPPSDVTALRLSLPPPLLHLISRHAAGKDAPLVVLLMGFDADYAAITADAARDDVSTGTFHTAKSGVIFVPVASSSSEVDVVAVHCSYPHMHLLSQWQHMQMHITFATIGSCDPPVASVFHSPIKASSSPLVIRSILSSLLSRHAPPPYSPSSSTSSARIAALAYASCNASVATAAHDGSRSKAELQRTIACLENELLISTMGLQLQCVCSTLLVTYCNIVCMYDCVVVNLDRRPDRWINMLLRLIAVGLPCSRLSAADGSKHSASDLLQASQQTQDVVFL